MFKKIISLVMFAVILFSFIVALQPSDFKVTRSAVIAAEPATVFAQVNNFHYWEMWSPWAKLDPNAKMTYEGAASGVGAIARWVGNNEVGEGSQTIIESRSPELIKIKLAFIKPIAGVSTSEFNFTPQENQTLVTWSMYGKNNFMGKAMGLFINCDRMVGAQFEKGLEQLKGVVEKK